MTVPVFAERPQVAVACGSVVGEAPIWDWRTGTLFWVDINGELLWSWQPAGGNEARSVAIGERVGFAMLTPDPPILLLGLRSGLARFRLGGGAPDIVLRPEPDRPGNRLNDAWIGPDGSIYFGSLNQTDRTPTGSFYRWSEAGLEGFGDSTVTTNGPAIDGERRILYAADTSRGHVYRHALAPDGTPGPREAFTTFAPGDGHPDGLTVDVEGYLWVCHFGGARITRFSPDGKPVLIVPMPTAQVTKIAFGGPDLATIYVTTAARDRDRETDPMAGHLFHFSTGTKGVAAEPCRMGLP